MKFEIDPNELTTDQRAHVAAFITGWPKANTALTDMVNCAIANTVTPISNEAFHVTEEQRLDAEQKSDMREEFTGSELREFANVNAIFGEPDKVVVLPNESVPAVPLDAQGLPWDSRIHASTKTLITDGSWKLRRGVDPSWVDTVKAQLKALMAVPEADVTIPVPPVPVTIGVDLIDQHPVTLTDLISRMSSAIAAGKLTQANVTEMCVKHGVSEFFLLGNRPDLFPLIDADMKEMGV